MKESKKILIITKNFPPQIDGVGDHSFQLANRLAKEGYNIEIITSSKKAISDFKIYQNELDGITCLKSLNKILQQSKPNFILFQYVPFSFHIKGLPFWLIYFFNSLKKKKINTLLFVHETFERRRIKLKHILLELLQKKILFNLCWISNVIFTTNAVYAKQLEKFKDKLDIARTPSNFEPLKIEVQSKDENENISSLNLIYFGNRDFRKSLYIFKELYDLERKFTLKILGKIHSDYLDELNKEEYEYLTPNIFITGTLSSYQITKEIEKATAYLLPEYVGFKGDGGLNTKSGTTATGFMLGKVVISTKGDMTEPLFTDLYNCILIDVNSPKKAAKKILLALTDEPRKKELEEKSRQLYKQHLSWKNTIKTICNYANTL